LSIVNKQKLKEERSLLSIETRGSSVNRRKGNDQNRGAISDDGDDSGVVVVGNGRTRSPRGHKTLRGGEKKWERKKCSDRSSSY